MIFEHASYRTFLRATLADRAGRNPRYSLRAMASQVGLAPSSLSEILKGKKNLSPRTATQVVSRLGLKAREAQYFCLLVQAEDETNPLLKGEFLHRLNDLRPSRYRGMQRFDLSVDEFKLVADWYHFPILELTKIPTGTPETAPKEFAKRLGITAAQAEAAIERLVRLKLVEADPVTGQLRKTGRAAISSDLPNSALRHFHRQMLAKAVDSLETQTPAEKVIGSETLAIRGDQVERARELINDCFEKIWELSPTQEESSAPTDVYHLGIQFFNLTPASRKKGASL